MNYLNGTEKLLKHWLKNKITITTSTVVGFLIMGSLAFGNVAPAPTSQDVIIAENQEHKDPIKSAVVTIKGDKTGAGSVYVTTGTQYIVAGIETPNDTNVKILNNGSLVAESKTNAMAYGINVFNPKSVDITNNGMIEAIGQSSNADGIAIQTSSSGKIAQDSKILNNKSIVATAQTKGSSSAISFQGSVDPKATMYIENNGELKAFTDGVRKNDRATVDLNNSDSGKLKFVNNGIVVANNGIGVALTSGKGLEGATLTNNGTIEVDSNSIAIKNAGGTAKTSGIIKITDKTKDELGQFDVNKLFNGEVTITGMIVDSQGHEIENDKTSHYIGGSLNTSEINLAGEKLVDGKPVKSVTIGKYNHNRITNETPDPIQLDSLNITGLVTVANSNPTNISPVKIDKTIINLDSKGYLSVGEKTKSELSISNGNVNKQISPKSNDTAIELGYGSVLNLNKVNFVGGISQINGNGIVNISGDTMINGKIGVSNINVGADKQLSKDSLRLASTSSFIEKTGTTITNKGDGVTVFDIGANGSNALKNSTGVVTVNGKIDFDTSSLTKDTTVELNNKAQNIVHNLSGANYLDKKDGLYTTALNNKDNTLRFEYNQNYFTDSKLNEINKNAQIINGKFSQVKDERERQMDKIYSGTIYSETIRGAYDNLKMNEKNILSLNNNVKANEFKAEGRALFEKNDYKREGIIQKYDATNKTSGVLASLEYGLTDTARTGLVLSGSKQDVKLDSGNANGDIFYVGVYGNQSIGNYDFTTGLGYQLGKYDANNTILDTLGTSKYDTKSVSGYAQVKYIGDLGRGVSIQPKLKMGYTHLKQDNIKDSYFGLRDADVKTFDAEIGADLVKTVRLAQSNLDLKLGTSYIKTYGDTDKMFRGQFFGDNTSSNQFEVSDIELSENVLRFNLGAEVKNDNGFFYNGGFTYQFGSENKTSYGASLGIGYTF